MHGLGNDFVIIDNRNKRLKNFSRLAKSLCDRRFGIGADQLLILDNSRKADFRMRIYNSDGSEVEMCGNGIRCLAKYIWDNKLETRNSKLETRKLAMVRQGSSTLSSLPKGSPLSIETLAGIIRPQKSGSNIKVDMGEPILEPEKIPVSSIVNRSPRAKPTGQLSIVKNYPVKIDRKIFKITCVSMGNPHAVIVANDIKKAPISKYGPMIERHRLFPKRTNVEFIQVLNRKNINMRVWERGAGETMACGTGASAAVVAANLLGLTDRKVSVRLAGGRMLIEWSAKDNHVYMTGPAQNVFEGTVEI